MYQTLAALLWTTNLLRAPSVPSADLVSRPQLTSELTPVEAELLGGHVEALERALGPGFSPLNWLSLAIPEFISTFTKVRGSETPASEGG